MDLYEKISEHVTYGEAIASSTAERNGIDNTPPNELIEVMKHTAESVFEPVRNNFNCRIAVTSFFRSLELNALLVKNPDILASKNSQHCKGEAMDINGNVFGGVTNMQIFDFIKESLDFDQLIWELGNDQEPEWVHVSIKSGDKKNRKQILRRSIINGEIQYENL